MNEAPARGSQFAVTAVLFEGGLALVAVAVGWLLDFSPLSKLPLSRDALGENAIAAFWGFVATLPMFGGLLLIERSRLRPLRRIRQVVDRLLFQLLRDCSVFDLAIVSLMAGVGEEVLFRGLIQDGLAALLGEPHGVWVAVVVTSVLFGFAHAITRTYIILAALTGVYLGLLYVLTGNLLAPIVAHALYDFGALVYFAKWRPGKADETPL